MVMCLPESVRLQTRDLGEGQVCVRFVSTERRQVNAAMKLCSFSGNSLVYLIVLFRQKFPLVSVIVVVGLANLSCCCDHCVNVANKPDKKNVRQRTPPSELILFWSHVTSVFQGLSLSLAP